MLNDQGSIQGVQPFERLPLLTGHPCIFGQSFQKLLPVWQGRSLTDSSSDEKHKSANRCVRCESLGLKD